MPYPTLGSDRERLNLDTLPVPLLFIVILPVPDLIHSFRHAWYLHLWLQYFAHVALILLI